MISVRQRHQTLNWFLILILLILTTGLVNAQPPFTETSTNTGCQIIYPKIFSVKTAEDFTFHFHVINASGQIINNNTLTCIFNLYDNNGEHLYVNENVSYDSTTLTDFLITVNGTSNFTTQKDIAYTFQCYNEESGCFASNIFQVTNTGFEDIGGNFKIFAYALFILTGGFILYTFIMLIIKFFILDLTIYDLTRSWIAYFLLLTTYYIIHTYLRTPFANDILEPLLLPFGITHILIATTGFIITFFYKGMKKKQPPNTKELAGRGWR